jgi:5-methylthioribose kinase
MTDSISDYLRAAGQLPGPQVTQLTGGVSGETFLVETFAHRVVIKRALARLLVAAEWTAKPERAMTEARALELLHQITPGHVPRLLHADPARHTIVMTAAPDGWLVWKDVLLEVTNERSLAGTARTLGTVLGTWHARTWHDRTVAAQFDDYEALDQLRVAPFHRAVAAIHTEVAPRIEECAQELFTRRDCLVHGDFSPKNVLVGSDELMVLDFEVAHFGAAVFDVAFLQSHLILKAFHAPHDEGVIADAAQHFLRAYKSQSPSQVERLGWHTAGLLLARVDGVSPVGYLRPSASAAVRRLALEVLAQDDPSITDVWRRAGELLR